MLSGVWKAEHLHLLFTPAARVETETEMLSVPAHPKVCGKLCLDSQNTKASYNWAEMKKYQWMMSSYLEKNLDYEARDNI